jgi:hypothetical protein
LIAAGLPARYREWTAEEVRWATGGHTPTGQHPRLVLAGQEWGPVAAQQVAQYALDAVTAGRVHVAQARGRGPLGGLLDDVTRRPAPVPPPAEEAPKPSRLAWLAQ